MLSTSNDIFMLLFIQTFWILFSVTAAQKLITQKYVFIGMNLSIQRRMNALYRMENIKNALEK